MAKNLGLETQLADSRAVQLGLRRSSRRGHFDLGYVLVEIYCLLVRQTHVFNTDGIQRSSNLELGLGVEIAIDELLALTQSSVDDAPVGHAAQGSDRSSSKAGSIANGAGAVRKGALIV